MKGVESMKRYIPVVNEMDGREWCVENGYEYLGTRIHSEYGFVMEYEDNSFDFISDEEEKYYLKQLEKEEALKEKWIIASEDGFNSTLYYTGNKERPYNFNINEAKKYTKVYAQKKAVMMTNNSKVGRVWFAMEVKR